MAALVLKVLFAAAVMCVLLATASGVATIFVPVPETSASQASALARVFLVCLVNTSVLVYALLRSAWSGWTLAAALFALHYGISAFMSQNETLYFNASLDVPLGVVWSYLAASAFTAVLFAPFAVWLFGRMQPGDAGGAVLGLTRTGIAWKAGVIACLLYPALYFLFGYFVLWQIPEARLLYQDSEDLLSFPQHMASVARDDPWIFPWQALRGLLWAALAALVMKMSRAGWAETAVLVGLLFALLMNTQHWIPNPYMSPPVQWGHFVETSISNFLLGFACVWLLRPGGAP
jgi:hypothetical protein